MTGLRPKRVWPVGLAGLLLVAGCVDALTTRPPAGAERWTGTSSAGTTDAAECGAFAFDLALYPDPAGGPEQISGRAHPATQGATRLERLARGLSSWWVEGYAAANDVVSFELRRQGGWPDAPRSYAVFRGTRSGDRITLEESGSPCARELVLARG